MSVAKAFSRGQAPQLNKSRLVRFVPSFYFSFNASKANDNLHSFTFKYDSRNKVFFIYLILGNGYRANGGLPVATRNQFAQ